MYNYLNIPKFAFSGLKKLAIEFFFTFMEKEIRFSNCHFFMIFFFEKIDPKLRNLKFISIKKIPMLKGKLYRS